MAGDDKKDDGFDPWAELESASTPEDGGAFDFAFDDKPATDAEPDAEPDAEGDLTAEAPRDEDPLAASEASGGGAGEPEQGIVADESVVDWLSEAAGSELEPTPLGLFAGDDDPADVGDSVTVRVGTGESGIVDEADEADEATAAEGIDGLDATPSGEGFGWSEIEVESVTESPEGQTPFGVVGSDLDDQPEEGIDFAGIATSETEDVGGEDGGGDAVSEAAGVAVVAAIPSAGVRPVKRRAAKKGGLGQMVGVVLGGLLALPITFAILIWGFRKDPLNLVRHVPDSVSFLFPAELVGGRSPKVDGVEKGPTLDDLPTMAGDSAVAEPGDSAGETAAEPAAEPVADPTAVATAEPQGDEPPMASESQPADAGVGDQASSAPLIPDATDLAALVSAEPAVPMIDPVEPEPPTVPAEPAIPAEPPPPPAPPEPEPLDLARIEAAAAAAAEALAAVERDDSDPDPDPVRRERSRKRLLVEWYRRLSAVAEELAGLERLAADTGRPLPAPPDAVAALQAAVVADPARLADLARLSRNWMAYPGRSTAGIVVPAVLGSVRQVGPYWCSTVTIAEAGDRTRDLAVISRAEPVAAAGEAVLVTGLIVDGDTVWASDVRPARAESSAGPIGDEPVASAPFSAPGDEGVPRDPPTADPPADPPAADPPADPTADPFATPDP